MSERQQIHVHVDRVVVDASLNAKNATGLDRAIAAGLASQIPLVSGTRALPIGAERHVSRAIVERMHGTPKVR